MYKVIILADSINEVGNRLTTFECTYPRFIHSELLTHRQLSRNSSSSRAIPISKMIEQVKNNPAMPVYWGKNQAGMQAETELDPESAKRAWECWTVARSAALEFAQRMVDLNVHKQIVNRLLEPWMWITTIISATEWRNFFYLRNNPDAQPEIHFLAVMMQEAYEGATPIRLNAGEWHLPFIYQRDLEEVLDFDLQRVASGRIARVSYLTHDGVRDPAKDIELCGSLIDKGHWSPLEHVAQASPGLHNSNFVGWHQYRKMFAGECFEGAQ